jgi:hypothetical protein
MTTPADSYPVFLLAPTPRSGTNFFATLLRGTNMFALPAGNVLGTEDFFIAKSGWLFRYADELERDWLNMDTTAAECLALKKQVIVQIGSALMDVAGLAPGKPLLLKTPLIYNIGRARDLFPSCRIIVLVRDGRDTAESAYRSGFHDSRAAAFSDWAARVRDLLEFTGPVPLPAARDHWIVVRYEDVLADPIAELAKICDFLGLQLPHGYEPDIMSLPVFGSSRLGRRSRKSFKFQILPRPRDFRPVGRWCEWDEATKQEFMVIAGKELAALGYGWDNPW